MFREKNRVIPVYLKLLYLAFMTMLIPAYWKYYGPANFLWISDIILILAFLAVLFENKILASMAAVGGLVLETFWTISFFLVILFDIHFLDLTDYMFDLSLPLWIRLLSFFHLILPPLLIWLVIRLGYFKKAVILQILLTWAILLLSWMLTDPSENINWVFSYLKFDMNPLFYLTVESLVIACILFLTHLFLIKLANRSHF